MTFNYIVSPQFPESTLFMSLSSKLNNIQGLQSWFSYCKVFLPVTLIGAGLPTTANSKITEIFTTSPLAAHIFRPYHLKYHLWWQVAPRDPLHMAITCSLMLHSFVYLYCNRMCWWSAIGGLACQTVAPTLYLLWLFSFNCIAALMSKGPCISERRPERTCLLKNSWAGDGPSFFGANFQHFLAASHFAMINFIWPTRHSQRILLGLL